jgi:hypothetical protein
VLIAGSTPGETKLEEDILRCPRAYVATMIRKRDQNSASCGGASFASQTYAAARVVFRELGSVVTVEPKWSLEGVFPSRAVFKRGRASGNTLRMGFTYTLTAMELSTS